MQKDEPTIPRIAVIQYPGSNCEYETARAVRAAGMDAEIFRWNRDPDLLTEFDGYIIPGGFSYQDRVRAGAIAAKKDIVRTLIRQAMKGKPILGICNGAQVLVEAGLVPGIDEKPMVQMALSRNVTPGRSGFYCEWVFVKVNKPPEPTAFDLAFDDNEIIPIPVAHGEGNFTTTDDEVRHAIMKNRQVLFQYCDSVGTVYADFPINPNGSFANAAGIINRAGNVLALMPHPERASWLYQLPDSIVSQYAQRKYRAIGDSESLLGAGPGRKIFASMLKYINLKGKQ